MTDPTCKTLRLVAAISMACLLPVAAFAQAGNDADVAAARRFTVEVIVFRYADSVSAGSEVFVPDPPPEPVDAAAIDDDVPVYGDSTAPDTGPVPLDADGNPLVADPVLPPRADIILLLDDELTMLSTWDRLDRLDAYEPLAHFGWHQQLVPFDEPAAIPFAEFGQPVVGMDGEFTLYLSRFLHLAVALELNANPNELEPGKDPLLSYGDDRYSETVAEDRFAVLAGPTFYRINEDRIFKSGDLRYFDHPRFGVIARIDRIEQAEPVEPDEPVPPAAEAAGTQGR